eukprot:5153181-Amphidinium_carterae.1
MRAANRFEAWRQFNMHCTGGHRANNFHYCVQSCLHNGVQTNIPRNSTTDGWKTSIGTNQKTEPSQTTSRLHQSSIT